MCIWGGGPGEKNISMNIRVIEDELKIVRHTVKILSYSSYSEFVRRIALIEAAKVIKETKQESLPWALGYPGQRPVAEKSWEAGE